MIYNSTDSKGDGQMSKSEERLRFPSVFSLNSVDLVKGGSKKQKAGGKQDQQPLSPELEVFSSPGLKVLKNIWLNLDLML